MTASGGTDKEREALSLAAAEYVLGLLSPAEMAAIQRALENNADLQAEVTHWETQFASFAGEIPPLEPPPHILRELRARIAPAPRKIGSSRHKESLWSSLLLWRGLSFASLTAAVIFGSLYFAKPEQRQPSFSDLVATISMNNGGQAAFVASYDAGSHQMLVVPAAAFKSPERVPELWIVPAGQSPISLGVLDASHPLSIRIPDKYAPHAKAGAVLVITLEPKGGAPGGVATGGVVAAGTFSTL